MKQKIDTPLDNNRPAACYHLAWLTLRRKVQAGPTARIIMPRLETSPPSYRSTIISLFSPSPDLSRRDIAKAILLQSVRLRVTRNRRSGGTENDEERLSGFQGGVLPLRIRPAFVVLNIICLLGLGVLGFHPRGQEYVPFNDKILHFFCFLFVSMRLAYIE